MKREKDSAYWFFVGIETGLGIAALAAIADILVGNF